MMEGFLHEILDKDKKKLLVVGDGDLSFCSLVLENYLPKEQLICSVYDSQDNFNLKYGSNIYTLLKLRKTGGFQWFLENVHFGTDATKLHKYLHISNGRDKIGATVWNLPYPPDINEERLSLERIDSIETPSKEEKRQHMVRRWLQLNLRDYFTSALKVNPEMRILFSLKSDQYTRYDIDSVVKDCGLMNYYTFSMAGVTYNHKLGDGRDLKVNDLHLRVDYYDTSSTMYVVMAQTRGDRYDTQGIQGSPEEAKPEAYSVFSNFVSDDSKFESDDSADIDNSEDDDE